jgi:hypothetical protein
MIPCLIILFVVFIFLTPFPVSPRGEMMVNAFPFGGRLGRGLNIQKYNLKIFKF